MRTADILVPTVTDEITEELLKQPDCRLKLIANFGNGVGPTSTSSQRMRAASR